MQNVMYTDRGCAVLRLSFDLIGCGESLFRRSHRFLWSEYSLTVDLIFIIENYWVILNTMLQR